MKLEQYLKQKGRIYLGNPLDLLLNDECKIEVYEKYCNDRIKNKENFEIDDEIKDKVKIGGILLPTGEDIGTGNIIIRGRPGTGKSTLAMQIAITCAQKPNNYLSAYISLEERAEHLITKAKEFNWNDYILSLEYLHNLDKFAGPEDYAELLRNVFKNNNSGDKNPSPSRRRNTQIKPCVLVPSLSPRSLSLAESQSDQLFWARYKELENIITGAIYWRRIKKENDPALRIICIDSLNIFGDRLLTREELFRIFDLFKRFQIIGIFVIEEDEKQILSPDNRLHGEMIEYLADVVISLTADEDDGYFIRYFEIVKSRYKHQIYGKHPFKIVPPPTN